MASRRQPKPIRIFYSPLSKRFYATSAYAVSAVGLVTVTGKKFDVTDDIADLIARNNITFRLASPTTGDP